MLAVVTKTKYFEQGGGETRKKKPSRFHSMQDNGSLNTVNPFEFLISLQRISNLNEVPQISRTQDLYGKMLEYTKALATMAKRK